MDARELLRQGSVDEALEALKGQVRSRPADAALRVFLFQLLSVEGDWERAMTQLNVSAELSPENLLMAGMYRTALECEAFRAEVFAGRKTPMILGEPAPWMGWMVQANELTAQGKTKAGQDLRMKAFEEAPASPGRLDGEEFDWIADADSRLGPMLEVVIEGRYYWAPFSQIRTIAFDEPTDLRDAVWASADFGWSNGGQNWGLIPARYPGSEASEDDAVRLSRKTEWQEQGEGVFLGLGQRMLMTDAGEKPLLEIRRIELEQEGPAEGEDA